MKSTLLVKRHCLGRSAVCQRRRRTKENIYVWRATPIQPLKTTNNPVRSAITNHASSVLLFNIPLSYIILTRTALLGLLPVPVPSELVGPVRRARMTVDIDHRHETNTSGHARSRTRSSPIIGPQTLYGSNVKHDYS